MTNFELVTAADVQLMQGLAQRVTAARPDLVNSEATFGELAWNWGKGHASDGASWPRRLWFSGGDLVAWGWAYLPHQVRRSDGSVPGGHWRLSRGYQVHPDQAELVDDVIDWYDRIAVDLERTVMPRMAGEFALKRWEAHGYETDPASLGDTGGRGPSSTSGISPMWSSRCCRMGSGSAAPARPGRRPRSGPSVDAWAPSTYTAEGYEGVRRTATYRGDLHVLVEAPDGTMASSTIMWLDGANKTAEFEPVGTHPDYRRLGLGTAMLLHGMHLARDAGATHMTVACLGAPGHPQARGLYYGVGFRPFTRDAPLIKTKAAG